MSAEYSKVISVAPNLIQIEITDLKEFKKSDMQFSIGSYLKITDDREISIVAIVISYRITDPLIATDTSQPIPVPVEPRFIIDAQPLGFIDKDGKFKRGGEQLTIPPTEPKLADSSILKCIYQDIKKEKQLCFGKLARDNSIDIHLDGDRFFSKHIAVLGSTGSGKSCTVAKILQEGIEPSDEQKKEGLLNNSHILIFDLHGEYAKAFPKDRYKLYFPK